MNKRFGRIDSDRKISLTSILYKNLGRMEEHILFWGYGISILNAALVYFSGGTTMVYANLNYVPIAMVSSTCEKRSRILHALVTALLIGPLMPLDTKLGISQTALNWTTRLGIYIIIAGVIGIFADINKRHGEELASMLSTDWLTSFKNVNTIKNEAGNTNAGTGFIAISVKGYEEVFGFFGNKFSDELGYQVAVDDFGSGYSSYKYIDIMPIGIIKIDRDIIGRMNGNEKTKSIVRSIVNLSKDNNMRTVAEGVETQEMADACLALGIDFMQGYLYHRPELIKIKETGEGI